MTYKEERKYLCILCGVGVVVEARNVETTDAIPDQCNCDLNKYTTLPTEGGKLLKVRPSVSWRSASTSKAEAAGALCTECLASPVTKPLVPHIAFE